MEERGTRRVLFVGLVAAVSGALYLGAAAPASAGTLDQSQTDGSGTFVGIGRSDTSGNVVSVAQTFTAGLSGSLDQVDLDLQRDLDTSGCHFNAGLSVEVRTVSAGAPGGTVVAGVVIPSASIPTSTPDFVSAQIPFLPLIAAGTQYALVASTTDSCPTTHRPYKWIGSAAADPYAGGVWLSNIGSGWTQVGTPDAAFRTFVAVPQTPAPQGPAQGGAGPTGQRGAALLSCRKRAHKHHWSHRRLKGCKRNANLLPV